MCASEPSLSVHIVRSVAEHAGTSPTKLPPLYDVLDPETLDDLFSHSTDAALSVPMSVSFPYAGYAVTVYSDKHVKVTDTPQEASMDATGAKPAGAE